MWWKAGGLLAVVVGAIVVGIVVMGGGSDTPTTRQLVKAVDRQFGVELTEAEARCMVDSGFGRKAVDMAGLACLQGEQRRVFADMIWRSVAPVPARQAQVDCFTAWAMREQTARDVAAIGAAGLGEDETIRTVQALIARDGVAACARA